MYLLGSEQYNLFLVIFLSRNSCGKKLYVTVQSGSYRNRSLLSLEGAVVTIFTTCCKVRTSCILPTKCSVVCLCGSEDKHPNFPKHCEPVGVLNVEILNICYMEFVPQR
jgi:hypothetical protein